MAGIYGLSKKGRYIEHWQEAFELATAITPADVGKAVTVDATGPKKVKLAGDGDQIIGRLEVVEIREQEGLRVGTVSMKGLGWFPVADGETVDVGDTIVGAGGGEVKAAATANLRDNFVQMVDGDNVFVIWQ